VWPTRWASAATQSEWWSGEQSRINGYSMVGWSSSSFSAGSSYIIYDDEGVRLVALVGSCDHGV
jgi:hypothetical protein